MRKAYILFVILAVFTFCLTAAALADTFDIVSTKAHITEGITCEGCHTSANVTESCIDCHANSGGTYRGEIDQNGVGIEKSYPESGKTKMASIHDSHGGEIRCTVCHTVHKEPGEIYCNYCHQFKVQIK